MTDSPVLLVSVPGLLADDLLHMVDQHRFTCLSAMIETGVLGIVSDAPDGNVTQQLWTIATGCSAQAHGVPGPYALMPEGIGIRPIARGDSRAAPLWEISSHQGRPSGSIAWPGMRDHSDRANLLVVTDDIHFPFGTVREAWPLLPGTISAGEQEHQLFPLRVHPSEIPPAEVDRFVPSVRRPELRYNFSCTIAAAATVQAVALHFLKLKPFHVIAVHFDFLDRVRRLRARYPETPLAAIALGYQFIDLLLANLRSELGASGTLIIVSPPARAHQRIVQGVLIMHGPGLKADELIPDVRLIDIAPTVLACAGAAIPRSWPGLVLGDAWENAKHASRCDFAYEAAPEEAWVLREACGLGLRVPSPPSSFRRQIAKLVGGEY